MIFFQGMTKTELTKAIREIIGNVKYGIEFENQLISDLIGQHHYYWSTQQIKPLKFKKEFMPKSYIFKGWTEKEGWKDVSWKKCIYKKDSTSVLVEALRYASHPFLLEHRKKNPNCEICEIAKSTEVDHVEPSFKEIAKSVLDTFSDEQLEEIKNNFDFCKSEKFSFPEQFEMFRRMEEIHKTATIKAVCKSCHLDSARERKQATKRVNS
jgi:hypothetical protein